MVPFRRMPATKPNTIERRPLLPLTKVARNGIAARRPRDVGRSVYSRAEGLMRKATAASSLGLEIAIIMKYQDNLLRFDSSTDVLEKLAKEDDTTSAHRYTPEHFVPAAARQENHNFSDNAGNRKASPSTPSTGGASFFEAGRPPRLHGTTGHSKYTNSLSMEAHEGESTKQPQEALLTSERTPLPGQQGGVDCQNNVEDLTSADGPDQEVLGACEAHVTSGAPIYHDQARDLDSVSEVSQYEDAHSDFVDE
ncbi:hypothetical protein GE09DRAFT_589749 [Coniochaeta sp. 2T2.1]|nr:hypothetical protein GE09DRAFT_589749 [Coniochaeta sp. 2T2.1]